MPYAADKSGWIPHAEYKNCSMPHALYKNGQMPHADLKTGKYRMPPAIAHPLNNPVPLPGRGAS